MVDFRLVFRLGDGGLDVVVLGSGVRVEESVDTLEGKKTGFGNEEVYERRGELVMMGSVRKQGASPERLTMKIPPKRK